MKTKNDSVIIVNTCFQTSSLTIASFFWVCQIQFQPKFLTYNSSSEAAKLHLFDAGISEN